MSTRHYRYYSCNIEAPYLKCRDITVDGSTLVDDLTSLQDKTQNISADPNVTTITGQLLVGTTDVDASLTSLDGRLDTAETNITSLDGRLDTAETDITTLDGRVDTAETNITSLDGRLDTAETDITSLKTRMTTAETNITTLDGRLDTAETDITSLKTRMTTAETNITTLDGRLDTAETDITTLDGRVDTAETNITSLGTRMTTAETNITTLDGRVDTAETDITTLDGRVDTAETNITSLDGRLDTAETDVTALETKTQYQSIPSTNNTQFTGGLVVTGDITVDTNLIKTDSTNNRVGINRTASSPFSLDVNGYIRYNPIWFRAEYSQTTDPYNWYVGNTNDSLLYPVSESSYGQWPSRGWDTATGAFECPVSGVYSFTVVVRLLDGIGDKGFRPVKNNGMITQSLWLDSDSVIWVMQDNSERRVGMFTTTVSCTAGDLLYATAHSAYNPWKTVVYSGHLIGAA
jgi:peptidoglycan hydrolase CwlO-like protein